MAPPLLTVVLPIRNRGGARLRNNLASLRWQEGIAPADVDILISDFGSASPLREELAQAADAHGARVAYTEAAGVWNRSRALNIGIKRARGRFTLCTDVDMVFAPGFLRAALDVAERPGARPLVLCQCHDLGPETDGTV